LRRSKQEIEMAEKLSENPTGYKNPPQHSRFRPGHSGNPSGRPKRPPSFAADLSAALAELVPASGDVRITKQRQIINALIDAASGGDLRAISVIVAFRAHDSEAEDNEADAPEDREILERHLVLEHKPRVGADNPSEPPIETEA
jgi:hypothetical protein